MRWLLCLLLLAAVVPSASATVATPDALAPLKWKARPLVILSDARDDPRVARQISALEARKGAAEDRNIAIVKEAGVHGPLHRMLGVAERGFAVVLVGKDGGVKKVWRDPVDPRQIFTIIDAMPMRRDEMKG